MQPYEVVDLIGEGAYGVVLKAKRKLDGTYVAIKKFKETDDDELIRKTTSRQLKVLKSLRHKNIVELKEAFKKKGLVHLVFEYLDNNLLEVLEKNNQGGLSCRMIAKYMYQVLEGLQYMHSINYIHRDIKPENLLVNVNGVVKICDMGFARQAGLPLTDYVATRWYRPPELLIGAEYGPPIDIWAVGCIMAELSDTQPLFPGSDQTDQLYQIITSLGSLPDCLNIKSNCKALPEFICKDQKRTSQTFLEKYRKKLTEKGVMLLKSMLELDPSKRITAKQALKHPFFDCVRPRLQRFQKTSQSWISCRFAPKINNSQESSHTERQLRSYESVSPLKFPQSKITEKEAILKPRQTSNFFKFGKKSCFGEYELGQDLCSKSNLRVNKIYKKKEPSTLTIMMPTRGHEKGLKGMSQEIGKGIHTSTQFKITRKKRQKSTYLGNM